MLCKKLIIFLVFLPIILSADDSSVWQYKTFIESNTEMTTVFMRYDDNTEKEVAQFLAEENVKLIAEDDRCIAAIASVTTTINLKKTLDGKIEICGLRDDNTYVQEKRIDELLLNWTSEHKGMLKGFCHVDSIYVVSVIFKHPETKRRYTVESLLTESNGEFSCWLPGGGI